jgi:Domain of unknown function (DUF4424)
MGLPMRSLPLLALSAALASSTALADDGAASIAAGGIVMTREQRITMAKEVLTISEGKVVVDYDFRNDTNGEITTEVAFPIPAYSFDPNGAFPQAAGFDDFRLWINGKPTEFHTQVRALLGKQDVTSPLKDSRVDVGSFGHYRWQQNGGPVFPDVGRLSRQARARLIALTVIDKDDQTPLWSVEKRYYWSQTFPAHATVHIRHQYTPVLGSTNSVSYGLLQAKEEPDSAKELASLCIDPALRRTLASYVVDVHNIVPFAYVDFILTTANTWKTPIEDFTLTVDRPHLKDAQQNFVSFCWDGPVLKTDDDHFTVHTTNLTPKKELRIGFISVYIGKN